MPATRRATLLLPEPAGPSIARVSLGMCVAIDTCRSVIECFCAHRARSKEHRLKPVLLEAHDVVAAVDVQSFAGDAGAGIGEEEGGGGAYFGGVDVAF